MVSCRKSWIRENILQTAILLTLLALPLFVFTPASPARAAAYVVSKTADTNDGVCDADCSLREAITAANANIDADTITFATSANGTITLGSALPTILAGSTITITGNGASNTIISGNDVVRVFSMGTNSTTTLNDLTVTDGLGNGDGGGIYASGRYLTLNRVTVMNSVATEEGGGIYINAGHNRADINNSRFTGNSAAIAGGGITSLAIEQYIRNTLIANNTAPGAAGVYGGVLTDLYVYNSTITDNTGTLYGGLTSSYILHVFNTIVANNIGAGSDCDAFDMNSFNNLIEDGTCGASAGTNGNKTGDPALNPDFTLSSSSNAIDAGNNAYAPAGNDLAGNARIRGLRVDMGAFESPYPLTVLTIQLTLQGRPPAPNASYMVEGEVEVRLVGGGAPILDMPFTANNMGQVTLPAITVGTYDVWVKGAHTLARLHEDVAVVTAVTMPTALLLEGDSNNDNAIQLNDFSLLATAFGTSVGDPGYDARCDFNMDGMVTLTDFSLMASNFSMLGDA